MLEQNVYTEIIESRQPIVLIKKLDYQKKGNLSDFLLYFPEEIFVNEARGGLTILEEVNGNRPGTFIISSKKVLNSSVHDKKATSSLEKITKTKSLKESQEKVLQCSLCSYHSYERKNDKSKYNRHLLNHSKTKLFNCSSCDFKTNSKVYFKIHSEGKHEGKLYKCTQCNYSSIYPTNLNQHEKIHADIKAFKCSHCEFRTKSKRTLDRHLIEHFNSVSKLFKCLNCSYETNRRDRLKAHLATHDRTSCFSCSLCDFKNRCE
ncbi:RE1-silencing transcription factor, partial [Armadillidium vulgare]